MSLRGKFAVWVMETPGFAKNKKGDISDSAVLILIICKEVDF